MEPIVSFTMPVDEFKNLLSETVRRELKALSILKDADDDKLLSRREVADMFGISLATLNAWCKAGTIKFKKVSSRVYFQKADVQAALETKPKYKRG
jgi:excisionase family DNA binding protein